MSSVKIDIQIDCDECANPLSASYSADSNRIYVKPCTRCMEKSGEKGEERGYDRGYLEGTNRTEPAF